MPDSTLLEKLCLVGDAVAGDPSHFMIERALAAMGVEWRFLSFQPPAERIADVVSGLDVLGFRGVRLRGAFQRVAAAHADAAWSASDAAEASGWATHLTRRDGAFRADDATGAAFLEALQTRFDSAADASAKRVVVLGAGGPAGSVAGTLLRGGAALVAVADRDADAARGLVDRLRTQHPDANVQEAGWEAEWFDTPEGVDWFVSTADWPKQRNDHVAKTLSREVQPNQLVIDLGVGSTRAPLLLAAADRGAKTMDGLPVLVAETALVLEAWTGEPADRQVLRDAAEEFLGL